MNTIEKLPCRTRKLNGKDITIHPTIQMKIELQINVILDYGRASGTFSSRIGVTREPRTRWVGKASLDAKLRSCVLTYVNVKRLSEVGTKVLQCCYILLITLWEETFYKIHASNEKSQGG